MATSQVFSFTGTEQTFTVPAGVTSLTIECLGAQGFQSDTGLGGRAVGTFTVTPGTVLYVRVGGMSASNVGGFNGGGPGRNTTNPGTGGGGASDVRTVTGNLPSRLIVAGGGGGRGITTAPANLSGGAGGGPIGVTGTPGHGTGGGGGTQAAGGAGSTGGTSNGAAGALGSGGGAGGTGSAGGGGGGGGFYGGGGGGSSNIAAGGSGGGGGSNGPTANLTTDQQGVRTGHGQITITYVQVSPVVYGYFGAEQTFVVPDGVTSLTAECLGAQGGNNTDAPVVTGGLGGRAVGTFAVTPGEVLRVYVGQDGNTAGGGAFGGGATGQSSTNAGGGGSDVRRGGAALVNRVIVAGGGGAAGGGPPSTPVGGTAGAGGGSTGGSGGVGTGGPTGGTGGTQSAGGGAGTGAAGGSAGSTGTLGNGGTGGTIATYGGGSGGGGLYGGGGGGSSNSAPAGGGGGGGGSNGPVASLTTNDQGVRTGHGQVTLTWSIATPTGPKTTETLWTVRVNISPATLSTTWQVLTPVTAVSATPAWRVAAGVSATASTTWNTAGTSTLVEASTSTTWTLAGQVTGTVGTAWQTRTVVTATVATEWTDRLGTGATVTTTWSTRLRVTKTTGTTWAIYERPFIVAENLRVQVEMTPGTWTDVTGSGHQIDIARHDGEPGTLVYEVLDAALDPVTATTLQMGDGLRVQVNKGIGWASVFTGQINDLQVDVTPRAPAGRQVNVRMSATDNVARLGNVAELRGVAAVDELRWLVGTTVPFRINGNSAPAASGTVTGTNDAASLWDQILVARDTALGYAWVDPDNVLNVYDAAALDTTIRASITPSVYSELDRDFTLDQVINQVTVNFRRYDVGTEKSTDVPYGPYSDGPSVAKWGPRAASFTIGGDPYTEDEADMATYAAHVLARNATAEHRGKTATIPANTPARLALVRDLDLNMAVSVTYQDTTTVATLRVVGIRHSVTVRSGEGVFWQTALDFATPTGIAMPSSTPPTGVPNIPPGSIGDDELDDDTTGRITSAAEEAAQALADAEEAFNLASTAATTVEGWTYTGTTKIDGGDIQADTIGAVQIGANAITAKHTLTGPLIQTTATANRGVKINATGLFAWDASGNPTFNIDSSTGAAVFKGSILSGSDITGANFQTASSGQRVAIGPAFGASVIAFYNAAGSFDTTIAGGSSGNSLGISGQLTLAGRLHQVAGGLGNTVGADLAGDLDMNSNDITEIGGLGLNAGATISGGPSITGGPTLSGGVVLAGKPRLSDGEYNSGANQDLRVTAGGILTTGTSTRASKEDVQPLDAVIDVGDVYELEPLAYRFRDRFVWGDSVYGGVMADEAEAGGLGIYVQHDEDGHPTGFDYDFFTSALLLAVRDLNDRVRELEARLEGNADG